MPGPSIASAAPTTASTMQVRRLSALERAVHSSTITTNTPAIGVKNPIRRRTPPIVARDCPMIPCHSGAISILATPSWARTIPAPNRRRRRPLPANRWETWKIVVAENASTTRLGKAQGSRIPKNRGWDTPLSRGLQLDDSAFQPDSDCVGSVVRAKFREDVLDVSLNRFLGN